VAAAVAPPSPSVHLASAMSESGGPTPPRPNAADSPPSRTHPIRPEAVSTRSQLFERPRFLAASANINSRRACGFVTTRSANHFSSCINPFWGNTGFGGYLFDFAEDLFGDNLVTGLLSGPHSSAMANLVPASLSHPGYSIQTAGRAQPLRASKQFWPKMLEPRTEGRLITGPRLCRIASAQGGGNPVEGQKVGIVTR